MENEVQNQQIETPEKASGKPLTLKSLASNFQKNKKVVIALVAILFLVLASILFGVLYSQKLKTAKTATKDETPKQELYGSLLLTPVSIIGTPGKKSTIDVVINTDAKKISGVVISLKFNPKILDNVTITPYQDKFSALGYSLKPMNVGITDMPGDATTTLKLPDGMQDLAGSGKIAEVNFTVKPLKVAVLSTTIEVTQLTGFLSSTQGEHTNLSRNQVIVTLPAGVPLLSPTTPIHK